MGMQFKWIICVIAFMLVASINAHDNAGKQEHVHAADHIAKEAGHEAECHGGVDEVHHEVQKSVHAVAAATGGLEAKHIEKGVKQVTAAPECSHSPIAHTVEGAIGHHVEEKADHDCPIEKAVHHVEAQIHSDHDCPVEKAVQHVETQIHSADAPCPLANLEHSDHDCPIEKAVHKIITTDAECPLANAEHPVVKVLNANPECPLEHPEHDCPIEKAVHDLEGEHVPNGHGTPGNHHGGPKHGEHHLEKEIHSIQNHDGHPAGGVHHVEVQVHHAETEFVLEGQHNPHHGEHHIEKQVHNIESHTPHEALPKHETHDVGDLVQHLEQTCEIRRHPEAVHPHGEKGSDHPQHHVGHAEPSNKEVHHLEKEVGLEGHHSPKDCDHGDHPQHHVGHAEPSNKEVHYLEKEVGLEGHHSPKDCDHGEHLPKKEIHDAEKHCGLDQPGHPGHGVEEVHQLEKTCNLDHHPHEIHEPEIHSNLEHKGEPGHKRREHHEHPNHGEHHGHNPEHCEELENWQKEIAAELAHENTELQALMKRAIQNLHGICNVHHRPEDLGTEIHYWIVTWRPSLVEENGHNPALEHWLNSLERLIANNGHDDLEKRLHHWLTQSEQLLEPHHINNQHEAGGHHRLHPSVDGDEPTHHETPHGIETAHHERPHAIPHAHHERPLATEVEHSQISREVQDRLRNLEHLLNQNHDNNAGRDVHQELRNLNGLLEHHGHPGHQNELQHLIESYEHLNGHERGHAEGHPHDQSEVERQIRHWIRQVQQEFGNSNHAHGHPEHRPSQHPNHHPGNDHEGQRGHGPNHHRRNHHEGELRHGPTHSGPHDFDHIERDLERQLSGPNHRHENHHEGQHGHGPTHLEPNNFDRIERQLERQLGGPNHHHGNHEEGPHPHGLPHHGPDELDHIERELERQYHGGNEHHGNHHPGEHGHRPSHHRPNGPEHIERGHGPNDFDHIERELERQYHDGNEHLHRNHHDRPHAHGPAHHGPNDFDHIERELELQYHGGNEHHGNHHQGEHGHRPSHHRPNGPEHIERDHGPNDFDHIGRELERQYHDGNEHLHRNDHDRPHGHGPAHHGPSDFEHIERELERQYHGGNEHHGNHHQGEHGHRPSHHRPNGPEHSEREPSKLQHDIQHLLRDLGNHGPHDHHQHQYRHHEDDLQHLYRNTGHGGQHNGHITRDIQQILQDFHSGGHDHGQLIHNLQEHVRHEREHDPHHGNELGLLPHHGHEPLEHGLEPHHHLHRHQREHHLRPHHGHRNHLWEENVQHLLRGIHQALSPILHILHTLLPEFFHAPTLFHHIPHSHSTNDLIRHMISHELVHHPPSDNLLRVLTLQRVIYEHLHHRYIVGLPNTALSKMLHLTTHGLPMHHLTHTLNIPIPEIDPQLRNQEIENLIHHSPWLHDSLEKIRTNHPLAIPETQRVIKHFIRPCIDIDHHLGAKALAPALEACPDDLSAVLVDHIPLEALQSQLGFEPKFDSPLYEELLHKALTEHPELPGLVHKIHLRQPLEPNEAELIQHAIWEPLQLSHRNQLIHELRPLLDIPDVRYKTARILYHGYPLQLRHLPELDPVLVYPQIRNLLNKHPVGDLNDIPNLHEHTILPLTEIAHSTLRTQILPLLAHNPFKNYYLGSLGKLPHVPLAEHFGISLPTYGPTPLIHRLRVPDEIEPILHKILSNQPLQPAERHVVYHVLVIPICRLQHELEGRDLQIIFEENIILHENPVLAMHWYPEVQAAQNRLLTGELVPLEEIHQLRKLPLVPNYLALYQNSPAVTHLRELSKIHPELPELLTKLRDRKITPEELVTLQSHLNDPVLEPILHHTILPPHSALDKPAIETIEHHPHISKIEPTDVNPINPTHPVIKPPVISEPQIIHHILASEPVNQALKDYIILYPGAVNLPRILNKESPLTPFERHYLLKHAGLLPSSSKIELTDPIYRHLLSQVPTKEVVLSRLHDYPLIINPTGTREIRPWQIEHLQHQILAQVPSTVGSPADVAPLVELKKYLDVFTWDYDRVKLLVDETRFRELLLYIQNNPCDIEYPLIDTEVEELKKAITDQDKLEIYLDFLRHLPYNTHQCLIDFLKLPDEQRVVYLIRIYTIEHDPLAEIHQKAGSELLKELLTNNPHLLEMFPHETSPSRIIENLFARELSGIAPESYALSPYTNRRLTESSLHPGLTSDNLHKIHGFLDNAFKVCSQFYMPTSEGRLLRHVVLQIWASISGLLTTLRLLPDDCVLSSDSPVRKHLLLLISSMLGRNLLTIGEVTRLSLRIPYGETLYQITRQVHNMLLSHAAPEIAGESVIATLRRKACENICMAQ